MQRTIVYTGRKIRVAVEEMSAPDGQALRRDIVLHPGAVAILPVIDAGHVCLLQNHRPAVGDTIWEIPAGTLEPGEPIEAAAERELEEETGYRAAKWTKQAEFFPSPGVLSERTHLFVAEDDDGERVGFLHLMLMTDFFTGAQNCHISDLATAPGHEGKGVGSALLAYSERFAREHHCRHVTLAVFEGNARARSLYESKGYGIELLRMVKPVK